MTIARRFPILLVAFSLCSAAAQAGAIVQSSLSLTELQILPSAGSVQFIPPINASAFAQVFDTLGGADAQFNTIDDGATSASAFTTLVNATAAASATARTGSVAANVTIGNITAAAGTAPGSPYGLLQGYFLIAGTAGAPISVEFRAALAISQLLSTTGFGQLARSEAIFSLLLPDISDQPVLFMDVPVAIGPNDSLLSASTPTLSATVALQQNTPYFFLVNIDPEVYGESRVPEPSSFLLLFSGLAVGLVSLLIRKNHARMIR